MSHALSEVHVRFMCVLDDTWSCCGNTGCFEQGQSENGNTPVPLTVLVHLILVNTSEV